jgi:hypothetical protein
VRSDRLYDARYRPRRRTDPIGAIVGILIVALIAGAVLVGGGAYLGGTLAAVTGPAASPGPSQAIDEEVAAAAEPTRRPTVASPAAAAPTDPTDPAAPADSADATPDAGPAGPLPTRRPAGARTDPDPDVSEEDAPPADLEAFDPSAPPDPTPHPWADLKPKPRKGAFAMDVWRDGAMASEATPQWCVPAAMLTMINLVKKRRPVTGYEEQKRLYALARKHSTAKLTGAGAEPEGWAEGLNREGVGPYIVHVASTRRVAIRQAARAIRFTRKPVGILAWRGAHSMVITGFKATADPASTDDFEVTDVVVADVWWPRVSSIWGTSLPPGTTESVERLAEDFLPWRRPDVRYPLKDGKYVVILPVRDDGRYDPSQDG